jgi:hypothetical protein
MGGNILSLTSYPLSVPGSETFAAGSFEGDAGLWGYDGGLDTWEQVSSLPDIGGAVRGLELADDGGDGLEEMLLGVSAPVDQVLVYRRLSSASAPQGTAPRALRNTFPNPARFEARLAAPPGTRSIAIYDAAGRVVRHLAVSAAGNVVWDLRDARGRRVPGGLYFAVPPRGSAAARRVAIVP